MSKYIGDKDFYRKVLMVAVPIMVQNGITNFVGLLDNIMVGQLGTEQMSGIAIINQLMMVFYLGIFGALSAAGIFGAQFYGAGDREGVRHAFRYKLYISALIVALGIAAFLLFGEQLIIQFLHDDGESVQNMQMVLHYGKQYLMVTLFGLAPFAIEEAYASTLRECGETKVPMVAGIIAVFVNLILNLLLIFGLLGFPKLGVVGAAVATVIARFVQLAVVAIWTHTHGDRMQFIVGIYRSARIPGNLVAKITVKGIPLMINEIMWAAGMTVLTQCYSLRGLDVVAGLNISGTITNLFNVVFMSMGNAIAIMVGQLLGAGKMEEAKDTDTKLIVFSVLSSVMLGAILMLLAPSFLLFYNTSEQVQKLAIGLMRISAACMPLFAFLHASYFTLRTGGKTFVTFLFDSVFLWCVSAPTAFILSRFTSLPIFPLYFSVQMIEVIKCIIGFVLVKKNVWMDNIVSGEKR